MKRFIGLTILVVVACCKLQAQHSDGNPFTRLGYKADVYTFGDKKEFHDQEEIVEIGDVLFNTKTNEVVGFVSNSDSLIELKPELQSMSIDPLCEKYYSISPYAYCMNNPVNAIDPDGRLVIFINGMHSGNGGRSDYWDGFDKSVMLHLNDYNKLYFDGSMGGAEALYNSIMFEKVLGPRTLKSINPNDRYTAGYNNGVNFASYILGQLNKEETIKVITHSMGAAYAKGMIQALIDQGIDPSLFAFEADFAPYQPTKQNANSNITTYQFSHKNDFIASDEKMEGAQYMDTSSDKKQSHGIKGFINQIQSLPSGKYKFVNGQIVPY